MYHGARRFGIVEDQRECCWVVKAPLFDDNVVIGGCEVESEILRPGSSITQF